MKKWGCSLASFIFCISLSAQYSWDWHDPLDLNALDLGDNKVFLYNAIGISLIHFLSQKNKVFSSGKKYYSRSVEYSHEYRKSPFSTIYTAKQRIGWKWKKRLWLGYELGVIAVQDRDWIGGLSGSPYFTWNIVNNNHIRLYYDNGVGPVYYFKPFPEEGTRFNFYTFYGLGMEIKSDVTNINIGVRNTHVSNADIRGRDRNPSFDGLGGYIELRF